MAAFGYLGRTQYNWETAKQVSNQGVSSDLKNLLEVARSLLCEIETAINGSFPNRNQEKLYSYSSAEMSKRLNFTTRQREQEQLGERIAPDSMDLRFTTDYFIKYLDNITKILEKRSKQRAGHRVEINMLDYSEPNSSASNVSWNSLQEEDSKLKSASEKSSEQQQPKKKNSSTRNHLKKRRRPKKTQQKSAELPAAA